MSNEIKCEVELILAQYLNFIDYWKGKYSALTCKYTSTCKFDFVNIELQLRFLS